MTNESSRRRPSWWSKRQPTAMRRRSCTQTYWHQQSTCRILLTTLLIIVICGGGSSSTCTSSGGIFACQVAAAWIGSPPSTTSRLGSNKGQQPQLDRRRLGQRSSCPSFPRSSCRFLSNDISDATTKDLPQEDKNIDYNESTISIRTCKYADLGAVADIIMESFYDPTTSWRGLYRVAELNRLQQNFPYADVDLHQMLVALAIPPDEPNDSSTLSSPMVVGFCDVDCRPCKTTPVLPRPYLSDLSVMPTFRRRGIARKLVEECETFVQDVGQKNELYIRVEITNEPAVSMYHGMQYQTIRQEKQKLDYKKGSEEATLLVLYKKFVNDDSEGEEEEVSPRPDDNNK